MKFDYKKTFIEIIYIHVILSHRNSDKHTHTHTENE